MTLTNDEYLDSADEPHKNHPSIFRLPGFCIHVGFWTREFAETEKSNKKIRNLTTDLVGHIANILYLDPKLAHTPEGNEATLKNKEFATAPVFQHCKPNKQVFESVSFKDILDYIEKKYAQSDHDTASDTDHGVNYGAYEIKFFPASRTLSAMGSEAKRAGSSNKSDYIAAVLEEENLPNILLRFESHREFITASIFFYKVEASDRSEASTSFRGTVEAIASLIGRGQNYLALRTDNDPKHLESDTWPSGGEENTIVSKLKSLRDEPMKQLKCFLSEGMPYLYNIALPEHFFSEDKNKFSTSDLFANFAGSIINARMLDGSKTWQSFLKESTPDWELRRKKKINNDYIPVGRSFGEKKSDVAETNFDPNFRFPNVNLEIIQENARRLMSVITRIPSPLPKVLFDSRNRDTVACLMGNGDAIYLSGLTVRQPEDSDWNTVNPHLSNRPPLHFSIIYLVEKRWSVSRLTRRVLFMGTMRLASLRRIRELREVGTKIGEIERKFANLDYKENGAKKRVSQLRRELSKIRYGCVDDEAKKPIPEGLLYRLSRSKTYQDLCLKNMEKVGIVHIPNWQSYSSFIEGRVAFTFDYINKIDRRLKGLENKLLEWHYYYSDKNVGRLTWIATVCAGVAVVLTVIGLLLGIASETDLLTKIGLKPKAERPSQLIFILPENGQSDDKPLLVTEEDAPLPVTKEDASPPVSEGDQP